MDAALQVSLSFTISWSLLTFMYIELVMLKLSHLLPPSSPLAFNLSQHQVGKDNSFLISCLFTSGGQSTEASASSSVLPMNIQGWFLLRLTGLICLQSTGLPRVFSAPQFKSINSLALSIYGPALTSVYDYWKNHSFDYACTNYVNTDHVEYYAVI